MTQLLVIAKAPVPGRVKTRLCPPCTPEQAAGIAAAALTDTITAACTFPATRHTLVIDGDYPPPAGWHTVSQHGDGLGTRLANGFADTTMAGVPSLLIGMDTPQLASELLTEVAGGLDTADAVLGPALDGGWWALALRDPGHAWVLASVPMSTSRTGVDTADALRRLGLRVAIGPVLTDVDTAADAVEIATACPGGAFAAAVRRHLLLEVGA
jgi:rSAM/selenodomain-associated transferase 1